MNTQTHESILSPILSSFSLYGRDPQNIVARLNSDCANFYWRPEKFLEFLEAVAAIETNPGFERLFILLTGKVLDQARMDHENEITIGTNLLTESANLLQRLEGEDKLRKVGSQLIGCAYSSAGLQIPNSLAGGNKNLSKLVKALSEQDPAAFSSFVKDILGEFRVTDDLGLSEFYRQFLEHIACIALPTRNLFVKESVRQIDEKFSKLGCMLLLEEDASIRISALEGLEDRLAMGKWTIDIYLILKVIRNWLTDTVFAERVDRLIDAAIEKHTAQQLKPAVSKINAVRASIISGAGLQTIYASVQQGNNHYVVVLYLKQRFGGKGAVLKFCKSKQEQHEFYSYEANHRTFFEVDKDYFEKAIGIALAEGLKHGHTPNPELVGAMEVSGLYDLRPIGSGSVDDVLSTVFAPEALDGVAESKKRQLIEKSCEWDDIVEDFGYWQEFASEITDALKDETNKEKKEEICWNYLEKRRDYWATKIAWIAMMVCMMNEEDRCGHDPLEFAVVAKEIDSGGELKEIPRMRKVVRTTIDRAR